MVRKSPRSAAGFRGSLIPDPLPSLALLHTEKQAFFFNLAN